MTRFLPRTLISQMIMILLAGLVVSHLVAGWIHSSDRARVVRAVGGYAAAQRIANLVRLIDEAPDDWRPRIIAAMTDPRLRITVTNEAPVIPPDESDAIDPPVRDYLGELLPPALEQRLRVIITRSNPQRATSPASRAIIWSTLLMLRRRPSAAFTCATPRIRRASAASRTSAWSPE